MLAPSLAVKPMYMRLMEMLVAKIKDGKWVIGNQIPNEMELSREYGVSGGTMRKALDLLEERGYVTRQQGRGTFVTDPAEAPVKLSLTREQARALLAALPDELPDILAPVEAALRAKRGNGDK